MKFAFEMCHASNMFHIVQGIIPDITVCLEVSLKTGKEIQRIFAASSRLILIQHNRMFCIASGSIEPHIALRLGFASRLPQHLEFCLIGIDDI